MGQLNEGARYRKAPEDGDAEVESRRRWGRLVRSPLLSMTWHPGSRAQFVELSLERS